MHGLGRAAAVAACAWPAPAGASAAAAAAAARPAAAVAAMRQRRCRHPLPSPPSPSVSCSAAAAAAGIAPGIAHRRRWASLPAAAAAAGRGGGGGAGAGSASTSGAAEPPLDAVIVLGGGLTDGGGLPQWVAARLDAAHATFASRAARSLLCLGAGTPHRPPVLIGGRVLHEATAQAAYLMQRHGVPAAALLKECASYDTVGNAYHALTMHAVPAGWRRLAVVTSAWHLPRAAAQFQDVGALLGASLFGDARRFSLEFVGSEDGEALPAAALAARLEKEAAALAAWRATAARLPDAPALHAWLHAEHLCYAVARQTEAPAPLDPRLAASY